MAFSQSLHQSTERLLSVLSSLAIDDGRRMCPLQVRFDWSALAPSGGSRQFDYLADA
jgi:hypothetical protein